MDEMPEKMAKGFNIHRFFAWVSNRKIDILITLVWSFLMALVLVKAYWFVYLENPKLIEYNVFLTTVESWVPRLSSIDYVFIIMVSITAGFLVMDIQKVIIECFIAILLSLVFAITWASFFIWYPLGGSEIMLSFGLDGIFYVVRFAFLNVFRMFFPFVVFYCFVASFIGAAIRERFMY